MIWHSDKPQYQKECCEKISSIMENLQENGHKQEWFQAFIYVFNLHWNKVDNYRIDKFLMFLRMMFAQLVKYVKATSYSESALKWYQETIYQVINGSQKQAETAQGIALQICDIFVQELNNVDKDASLDQLAGLLQPFLRNLAQLPSCELRERLIDKVFYPVLENNTTEKAPESEDEEEVMKRKEKHHRTVDGGKLPPKTQKEIEDMLNQKYVFSGFNILIYA